MLHALDGAGWHNYSLFLADDGELIGYFETPSLDDARRLMARTDVNARWQTEMADFFEGLGDSAPDQGFIALEEIFHLEDQLYGMQDADRTTT
jgi:L-rhamnose mutarotase